MRKAIPQQEGVFKAEIAKTLSFKIKLSLNAYKNRQGVEETKARRITTAWRTKGCDSDNDNKSRLAECEVIMTPDCL
ncbi:hypothetical protein J6590_005322 [Homalodisca vitripennis]|nr:hypothetical protein J6590_005322 [Homalodisca vitripennis]